MTSKELPKIKVEEMKDEAGETFYRARVQVRGKPRFHTGDGQTPSEALLIVAARWHSYNDLLPL